MDGSELRARVVRRAESLLGLNEADGSHSRILEAYNRLSPLPRGYRMRGDDPWCAAFVSAVGQMEELSAVLLPECSCEAMLALYRARGLWSAKAEDLRPGDLVFYDWDGDGLADHVGILSAAEGAELEVIEGNCANAVRRRSVPRSRPFLCGFARPDYASAAREGGEAPRGEAGEGAFSPPLLRRGSRGVSVLAMQAVLILRGWPCGPDGADGDFGANTEAALRRFQRENGLEEDGICGVESWKKLLGVSV